MEVFNILTMDVIMYMFAKTHQTLKNEFIVPKFYVNKAYFKIIFTNHQFSEKNTIKINLKDRKLEIISIEKSVSIIL